MSMRIKAIATVIGFLVAGGAFADASAATVATTTRTAVATHAIRPVVAKKIVRTTHRVRRPHLAVTHILPGHRLAPRIAVARAVTSRHVVKATVIR